MRDLERFESNPHPISKIWIKRFGAKEYKIFNCFVEARAWMNAYKTKNDDPYCCGLCCFNSNMV